MDLVGMVKPDSEEASLLNPSVFPVMPLRLLATMNVFLITSLLICSEKVRTKVLGFLVFLFALRAFEFASRSQQFDPNVALIRICVVCLGLCLVAIAMCTQFVQKLIVKLRLDSSN
jgi:hypothetical protein